ncbi:MAG: HAD family phosphatase [Actinobacteria bacterium]|nr:HAD family phosphatase [Actinomycetota bacterium]
MTSDTLAAVLWDMDGTLIDSEPLWIEVELAMLRRYGLEMSAETHERMIGSGLWEAAEHFRELGVPLSADEIVAEWVESVERGIAETEPQWRPGARELLASLLAAGIPCALVTMSTRSLADAVVAMLPQGTFQAIIAGDEVEHEKPHPDPYLRGAAALGIPTSACLAFEDSPTGLTSAHASGAVAIGVPNMVSLDEAPSHALLPTLAGLDAEMVAAHFARLREQNHTLSDKNVAEEAVP